MIKKTAIVPTADSKYTIIKKTANNKSVYVLQFANPCKLDSVMKYREVPGKFAFDTMEEAMETIKVFRISLQESVETVYKE